MRSTIATNTLPTLLISTTTLRYGNGKEGLVTIVDRLERAIESAQGVGQALVTALIIAFVIGLIILVVQAGLLR
jgi:hypothetical protein